MEDGVRINKYLARAGVASRRGSDAVVEAGRVRINGREAVLGDVVRDGDVVTVDGKPVKAAEDTVLLAYNKPRGITCTADRSDPTNIIDAVGYPRRVFYVGRLDKDSQGLVLLTNDGDLADRIMRSRYGHEKEYLVTVDRDVEDGVPEALAAGVDIGEGEVTRKCSVELVGPRTMRIVLMQGLNRQIRRMCQAVGYDVVKLVRVRIMNIRLGKLKEGTYRELTREERAGLVKAVRSSVLAPKAGEQPKNSRGPSGSNVHHEPRR